MSELTNEQLRAIHSKNNENSIRGTGRGNKVHKVGTKFRRISDGKVFIVDDVQMSTHPWGKEADYKMGLQGKKSYLMVPERNLRDNYEIIKG